MVAVRPSRDGFPAPLSSSAEALRAPADCRSPEPTGVSRPPRGPAVVLCRPGERPRGWPPGTREPRSGAGYVAPRKVLARRAGEPGGPVRRGSSGGTPASPRGGRSLRAPKGALLRSNILAAITRRRPLAVAATAAAAGLAAALLAALLAPGLGAVTAEPAIAGQALPAATGAGCGVAAVALVGALRSGRGRFLLAAGAGSVAAAASIFGLGDPNLAVTTPGVRIGCAFGLPRCIPTGDPEMSLLVRAGPVQHRPVVHVIVWGLTSLEQSTVAKEEQRAPRLGQPLLEEDYHVGPAKPGGLFIVPGSPTKWLAGHHEHALTKRDIAVLVHRAAHREHWSATPDTQWWVATSLSAAQMGLGSGSCADHLKMPSVGGVVVRLPLSRCAAPPSGHGGCPAVSVQHPSAAEPASLRAGTDLLIVHEFAEAATDPVDGWRVLVASRCGSHTWLEIADVCAPDSAFIRAPPHRTPAGWQPSLLAPGRAGKKAYCADPADPRRRVAVVSRAAASSRRPAGAASRPPPRRATTRSG